MNSNNILRPNGFPAPIMPSNEEVLKKLGTRKAGKRKLKRQVRVLAEKYARKHLRDLFKNKDKSIVN